MKKKIRKCTCCEKMVIDEGNWFVMDGGGCFSVDDNGDVVGIHKNPRVEELDLNIDLNINICPSCRDICDLPVFVSAEMTKRLMKYNKAQLERCDKEGIPVPEWQRKLANADLDEALKKSKMMVPRAMLWWNALKDEHIRSLILMMYMKRVKNMDVDDDGVSDRQFDYWDKHPSELERDFKRALSWYSALEEQDKIGMTIGLYSVSNGVEV